MENKKVKLRIKREIAFLEMLENEHNNKKRLESIRLRLVFLRNHTLNGEEKTK